jgi:hypothetical protein
MELFGAPGGFPGGFNGSNGPRGCPGGSGSGYTGRGRRATKSDTPLHSTKSSNLDVGERSVWLTLAA